MNNVEVILEEEFCPGKMRRITKDGENKFILYMSFYAFDRGIGFWTPYYLYGSFNSMEDAIAESEAWNVKPLF